MTRPRVLIEDWLPIEALGIESRRERAVPMDLPPIFALHVWWARRPLVASAGVLLASLLPSWSPELATAVADERLVSNEAAYRTWFMRLCGILGDPVAARKLLKAANDSGTRLKGNGYGYSQAFKNSPSRSDLMLLSRLLEETWGERPKVLAP